ncbi:AAA family ATPase [Vibrio cholerae]
MLKAVEIKNFKSAEDLKLEFGRVNVFIGENGSGKSTILEALTFAAAAESDRLDNEFLANRGIRITTPQFMRSRFDNANLKKPISIRVIVDKFTPEDEINIELSRNYLLDNDNKTYSSWKLIKDTILERGDQFKVSSFEIEKMKEDSLRIKNFLSKEDMDEFIQFVEDTEGKLQAAKILDVLDSFKNDDILKKLNDRSNQYKNVEDGITEQLVFLKDFVIYSPQHHKLRNLIEEGSLRPLGVNGDGLFTLLREINKKQHDAIVDIENGLKLIGWYSSMSIPDHEDLLDDEILLKDKYLPVSFSQRSANEGFLYVLFYMALIVSKDTPKIFAIDNIDSALNPKLCRKIMEYLVVLADKYGKQVFITTQNSAVLDGLDLSDEEQRLFVVSRDKQGRTKAKRLSPKKKLIDSEGQPMPLSEAMLRGYIGGLPKGF